MTWVYEEG